MSYQHKGNPSSPLLVSFFTTACLADTSLLLRTPTPSPLRTTLSTSVDPALALKAHPPLVSFPFGSETSVLGSSPWNSGFRARLFFFDFKLPCWVILLAVQS